MSITCSWEFQIRWKLFLGEIIYLWQFYASFYLFVWQVNKSDIKCQISQGFQTRNIFFFSIFSLWLIRRNNKQNLKTKEKWKFYDNQAMLLCMNMKKANKRGIKRSIWDHDYWLIRFRCDYCLLIFFWVVLCNKTLLKLRIDKKYLFPVFQLIDFNLNLFSHNNLIATCYFLCLFYLRPHPWIGSVFDLIRLVDFISCSCNLGW